MGTNFYTNKKYIDSDNPKYHIGKRSAAGLYCWDCKITLCKQGIDGIHKSYSIFYSFCPKCEKNYTSEKLEYSSVGRELGLNKSKPDSKIGVNSCSSFSWAMPKDKALKYKAIYDEYGRKYTREEFLDVLKECPIEFDDSIGKSFC